MGYCICYEQGEIDIKKEKMPLVLEALKKLGEKFDNELRYASITISDNLSIETIFENLRYEIVEYDDHYTIGNFYGEKYGDDEEIFKAIAPYCEDGYLQFVGEDGDHFRFYIDDGTFREKYARLVWD